MHEEDFSLGDSTEHEDFSLGTLDSPVISANPSDVLEADYEELQWVYDTLHIADISPKQDLESFFKLDARSFVLLGKENFEILSSQELEDLKKKIEKWIGLAHKKWIAFENQKKIENLTLALQELEKLYEKCIAYPIFAEQYIKEIKKNLSNQLNSFLNQKIKDKILDVSEILEVIEYAIDIHLISDSEEGRKFIVEKIRSAAERQIFKIESFDETFSRLVGEKQEVDRFDTDIAKKKLFEEYKSFYALHLQITSEKLGISDSELYEKMYTILVQNNLLVDNVAFYRENFFDAEKSSGKYNFSLPLNDEYYYYLKGTAVHNYQFSEEQWDEFVRTQNLHKEDDASLAFIMGTEKAVTLLQIADLLEENPNMALSRIRAGDVETYLLHIGQLDMAKRLISIKEELKNDTDILVQAVVNLLRGVVSQTDVNEEEVKSSDSLLPLIENRASLQELVFYLLRRKQFEALNKKILSPTAKEHTELENYLLENGFTFTKLCMNYLHEFLEENNASVYKNMYEKYAEYVLEKLTQDNDALTFVFVFKPILEEAGGKSFLSESFTEKYKTAEKQMNEAIESQKTNINTTTESKPKKSFFGFRK